MDRCTVPTPGHTSNIWGRYLSSQHDRLHNAKMVAFAPWCLWRPQGLDVRTWDPLNGACWEYCGSAEAGCSIAAEHHVDANTTVASLLHAAAAVSFLQRRKPSFSSKRSAQAPGSATTFTRIKKESRKIQRAVLIHNDRVIGLAEAPRVSARGGEAKEISACSEPTELKRECSAAAKARSKARRLGHNPLRNGRGRIVKRSKTSLSQNLIYMYIYIYISKGFMMDHSECMSQMVAKNVAEWWMTRTSILRPLRPCCGRSFCSDLIEGMGWGRVYMKLRCHPLWTLCIQWFESMILWMNL